MGEQVSTAAELVRAEALSEEVDALLVDSGVGDLAAAERDLAVEAQELEEAEAGVAELEGRLDDGDVDVEQEELESAQRRVGFLRRRLEAFRVRVERARQQARERDLEALRVQVLAFADDASLEAERQVYATVVAAAGELRQRLAEREQRRLVLAGQVEALGDVSLRRWLVQLSEEQLLAALTQEVREGAWPVNRQVPPHVLHDPLVVAEQQRRHLENLERVERQRVEQAAVYEAERLAKLRPGPVEPADESTYRVYG